MKSPSCGCGTSSYFSGTATRTVRPCSFCCQTYRHPKRKGSSRSAGAAGACLPGTCVGALIALSLLMNALDCTHAYQPQTSTGSPSNDESLAADTPTSSQVAARRESAVQVAEAGPAAGRLPDGAAA